jgi:hypothetical protein
MKAAAVVCTYGRLALCELLACVERQTLQLPLLVFFDGRLTYTDGAPVMRFDVSSMVEVVEAPRQLSLGLVRRAAVEAARQSFELDADSAVLVLDDDDFYSARHFELTLAELERAPRPLGWTGALAVGLVRDGGAPELVEADSGVGLHATWGYTLGAYDAAGGYPDLPRHEDVSLGHALGWHNCQPHRHVTHVRRHHNANISGGSVGFDRDLVRVLDSLTTVVRPAPWSPELEQLERWCQAVAATQRSRR